MYTEIKRKIMHFDKIYIYGNGILGNAVKKWFENEEIDYAGVIVSKEYKKLRDEFEIDELYDVKESTGIVLAVDEKYYTDIVYNICKSGYYHILFFSSDEKRGILNIYADIEKLNEQFMAMGGSKVYWEERYKKNGNSGSGSYNNLADFKASIINCFLQKHTEIRSCMEWGCGDGNQLAMIEYPEYIGTDVSETALDICRNKFQKDKTKKFISMSEIKKLKKQIQVDLAISLDVLFHLVEDDVFEEYMKNLFNSANKYVCIYSSNFEKPQTNHECHRKFTDYVDKYFPEFSLIEKVNNRYPYDSNNPDRTSLSDFYFYAKDKIM